jgi:hypothetical protein
VGCKGSDLRVGGEEAAHPTVVWAEGSRPASRVPCALVKLLMRLTLREISPRCSPQVHVYIEPHHAWHHEPSSSRAPSQDEEQAKVEKRLPDLQAQEGKSCYVLPPNHVLHTTAPVTLQHIMETPRGCLG